jgi:hypothetical protein
MDIDAVAGRCAIYRNRSEVFWSTKYLNISNSYKFGSKSVAVRLKNQKNAPWIFYGVIRSELWRKLFALSFENYFNYPMTPFSVSRILDKVLCRIVLLEQLVWIRREQVIHPASTHKTVNQFLDLVVGSRFLTRLKILGLTIRASRNSSNSKISVQIGYRIWRATSHQKFRKGRVKNKFRKTLYRFYLKSKFLLGIFQPYVFPKSSVSKFAVAPSRKLKDNIKDCELETLTLHIGNLGISYDSNELKEIENLLLMPREELRLRANI